MVVTRTPYFLFSDFFYGGQDIGLYFFGAVPCGVFVYSANYIGNLGLPFTGGDDFNGHNLPFGHLHWPKRSEYAVFKNGLNDLGHAITTLLNYFSFFYHGNKFLSKIADTGADINGDGKLRMPEMINILRKAAGVRDTWNQRTCVEEKEGVKWPDR
jgi:hypothetical protein